MLLGKHLCQGLFFNKVQACNFTKKEALAQEFSCEFCEISRDTFFAEHLWATASNTLESLYKNKCERLIFGDCP